MPTPTFTTSLKSNSDTVVQIYTASGVEVKGPFGTLHPKLKSIDFDFTIKYIMDATTGEIIFDNISDHFVSHLEDFIQATTFRFGWEK